MRKLLLMIVTITVFGSGIVSAHHSNAIFDLEKLVLLRGTVISFTNLNPHAWISVNASADGGSEIARWDVESTAPQMLAAMGISPQTLSAGDSVTIGIRPMHDGRNGGSMVFLITPDGIPHGADPAALGLDLENLKP